MQSVADGEGEEGVEKEEGGDCEVGEMCWRGREGTPSHRECCNPGN